MDAIFSNQHEEVMKPKTIKRKGVSVIEAANSLLIPSIHDLGSSSIMPLLLCFMKFCKINFL